MKVVLAEKPSVARDIAQVLGANSKKNGYFEGNGYAVTYAFGHLVTIAEPEEMNSAWGSPWRLEQLPMIPDSWKYSVVKKSAPQFNIIKHLFMKSETDLIICATDAGREGEHIFRLIYKMSGCQKPIKRLWISSLTQEAIKDGFEKLKSGTEFDDLADAASARAHADWIVGLNFTRAYTSINRELFTVGRVQTPTLALLVDRQTAIDNFKPQEFFEIDATFAPGFTARYTNSKLEQQTRLPDRESAQAIIDAISPLSSGIVKSLSTKEKKSKPPALYDLLTLQKEANKRFGYTAQETLAIAQSLYEERKLISYPRTESRHISKDMVGELPRILSVVLKSTIATAEILAAFQQEEIVPGSITASMLRSRLDKSYVDDTKLTDHHAIIPTHSSPPADLPIKQANIYKLIASRFMSIFLPPEIRDETTAIIKVKEYEFRARGVVIKQAGWTLVEPRSKKKEKSSKDSKGKEKSSKKGDDGSEDLQQLPAIEKGQELEKLKEELKEGKTSPPKPYDDGSLLAAMKNAGQDLDDEDLASYMKQKGLGTPATRAAIIERLLQTGYIERNKKSLLPTAKGKALIDRIHSDLKDIGLTASWEQQLADMQDGKLKKSAFEKDIGDFVRGILPAVSKLSSSALGFASSGKRSASSKTKGSGSSDSSQEGGKESGKVFGQCPQCKAGIVRETPKGAGCNRWREGCNFSIWQEQYGKKLADANIKELVSKGKTKLIKGFKKKDGSGKYDACLVLNDEFKVRLDFSANGEGKSDVSFGSCPQCKEGTVKSTPRGAGCSRWKEGCGFTVWRTTYGKELSDDEIKQLVVNKTTGLIRGFKKKSGTGTYDATLVLNDEFKVRLSFDSPPPAPPAASPSPASV